MSNFKSQAKRKRELAKLDKRQAKDQKRELRRAERSGPGIGASAPAVSAVVQPMPTSRRPEPATAPVRKPVTCQGLRIRAIPVHHPVYSVGYIVEGKHGAIAFSGDTGPTDELWKAINATPDVKAVFVELSFPSTMQWLADVSGHLTPRTVMSELTKLDRRGAQIYLYHLKPAVIDEVKAEVKSLRKDFLHVCELDEVYSIR